MHVDEQDVFAYNHDAARNTVCYDVIRGQNVACTRACPLTFARNGKT